ncbi:Prephenate dehydratase [Methanococcus vannielii SB]|uniref:Prephenate dehydratase n=1 Tax=Methanococcus vannielii (strain ATCC 35089 / DSM 1224 / JCM 13029 / OCM 148 / SB) TaxID=406327 RepID=A6UQH5_METVS|nr:prephenate dehydratase [Methanococcus vannielii]ABR54747.1 Prephenate dehydratase [Methanococcus vannielii SB]
MICCLGPKGSYSEKAAQKFSGLLNQEIIFKKSIYDVFKSLETDFELLGVVPSENSIEGSVTITQDLFLEFPVKIIGEVDIEINHSLIGYNIEKIREILSHPQALAQCGRYIYKHGWKVRPVESTAKAAKIVFEEKNEELAAIGSIENARIYGIKVLEENVQDYQNNKTRFFLICNKNMNFKTNLMPSKSTIIVELKKNRPGAFYELLEVFKYRNVNLTRIESRPSKKEIGNYVFYIDYEQDDDNLGLLTDLRKRASNVIEIGSYFVIR